MSYTDRVFYDLDKDSGEIRRFEGNPAHPGYQGTRRVSVGPSVVTPVCGICGALLADQQRHDEWHELVDPEVDQ